MGSSPTPTPPVAPRKDYSQVWHGRTFVDPYHWLRAKGTPEVVAHLEAENAYTEAMTTDIASFSDALYAEMLGRIKQTDLGVPTRIGRFYYYRRTVEGLQYPIRCRKPAGPDGAFHEGAAEEVLLDQNAMARGLAFLAIGEFEVSDDAERLLYSIDDTGFRQYQLFVKDLKTGAVQGPLAERVTSAAWSKDDATVFYVTEHPVTKRSDTLWRLALGGQPEKVYEETDELFSLGVGRTKDRTFVVLGARSTDTWDNWLIPAATPATALRRVLPREKGHKYDVEHRDGVLFIRTNKDAKNFRLVTAPLSDPSPASWRPLLDAPPRRPARGGGAVPRLRRGAGEAGGPQPPARPLVRGRPVARGRVSRACLQRLRRRHARVRLAAAALQLPEPGDTPERLRLRHGGRGLDPPEARGGAGWLRPATLRLREAVGHGTRRYAVPISIVYPKGFVRDGKAPLWLYGYGSYGYGMPASFDSLRLSLLERGIPYAIAHVRGGNEMGESWHDDGMLMKKKNTFFDFIDCAELLVREKWTSPDRLLIEGGSAGGLLMGAVVNERPDLFRAVHAAVPFVDVVSTMMDASLPLTVGEYLEWGNPNEKPAFDYLLSYSPYDNLAKKPYPALLVTTSYNDSQVMYWEPAKYVAKLRTLKTDSRPLLLKTKMQPAGHGGASGRYDALHDRAFEVAWMLNQVGITR